jgi:hypothetical protein
LEHSGRFFKKTTFLVTLVVVFNDQLVLKSYIHFQFADEMRVDEPLKYISVADYMCIHRYLGKHLCAYPSTML